MTSLSGYWPLGPKFVGILAAGTENLVTLLDGPGQMLPVPALVVKVGTVKPGLDHGVTYPAGIGADGLLTAVAGEVIIASVNGETVAIVRRIGMEHKAGSLLVARLNHILIGNGMRLGSRDAHPQVHDVDAIGQTDDALAPRGGILVAARPLDGSPVGVIDVANLVSACLIRKAW